MTLGFLGNTMGIVVVARKKLERLVPVLIYIGLFISDTVNLSMYKIYLIYIFLKLINAFI